jgi:hypothetical protein
MFESSLNLVEGFWHFLYGVTSPTHLSLSEPTSLNTDEGASGGYCVICQNVGNFISTEPLLHTRSSEKKHYTIRLGNLADLQSKHDCTCCQSTISALLEQGVATQAQLQNREAELCWNGKSFNIILHSLDGNDVNAFELCLTKLPSDLGASGRELFPYDKYRRLMDSKKIDTTVIQEWVEACDRLHDPGAQSIAPLLSASELPWLYLIDLERQCLAKVDTAQSPRYIALSYVWGGVDMLKTTTKNLDQMLQPGTMHDIQKMKGPKLAQTIVDAMDLARELGCRFFWTDCVCIVQDDDDERTMFLNGMASIYANAYFTIVAGEGADGNHGIPGIGCSKSRNTPCSEMRFPGHTLSLGPNGDMGPLIYCRGKAWSKRGWTLQESYLSRRLLVFSSIVSFHCQDHTSVEWDLAPHSRRNRKRVDRTSFVCNVPEWPDIGHFTEVAAEYSQKHLSFDDDILHAFAGIATVLSQSFQSGFHYGLPEMYFDASLLWESDWQRPDPPEIRKTQKLSLPSWSWMRMKGSIKKSVWELFAEDFYKDTSFPYIYELKPRVQWWKTDSEGEALKLIKYQDFSSHASMPPGWKSDRDEYTRVYRYNIKYSHALSPNTKYPHPFPFPDIADASLPDNKYGTILRGVVKRGWLLKSSKLELHDCDPDKVYGIFNLCVSDGTWAGILIDDRLGQGFPQSSDEKCEVIAIAEGRVPDMSDDHYLPEHAMLLQATFPESLVFEPFKRKHKLLNRKKFCYEFYFVLWIVWIDGIAYRRGIGRVLKTVWESMDLEEIEVRLG